MSITYKKSGVDYSFLDPIKILAQKAAAKTSRNLDGSGFSEKRKSRGESAYILEASDAYLAFVAEGLGTKNLVADEMRKIGGKTYYEGIAQDTVAMIINDLITVGAKPLTILAYWSVGDSSWWRDSKRANDLIYGWQKACQMAEVVWGGGETPTLKDVILPATIDLGGAAFGIIKPKEMIVLGDKLKPGDDIILLSSSGIHANGLSLARKLADNPGGLTTKLTNGQTFGEALLTPTIIYSKLINNLQKRKIDIHYMVNITGHGWRKIMRAKNDFSYVLENLPVVSPLFIFIQKKANLTSREMYSTFNMGAGFALFTSEKYSQEVIEQAKRHNISAWVAGKVTNGPKRVIIKPLNIIYQEKDLKLRY